MNGWTEWAGDWIGRLLVTYFVAALAMVSNKLCWDKGNGKLERVFIAGVCAAIAYGLGTWLDWPLYIAPAFVLSQAATTYSTPGLKG